MLSEYGHLHHPHNHIKGGGKNYVSRNFFWCNKILTLNFIYLFIFFLLMQKFFGPEFVVMSSEPNDTIDVQPSFMVSCVQNNREVSLYTQLHKCNALTQNREEVTFR